MAIVLVLSLLVLVAACVLAVVAGAGRHVPLALWVFPPALGFGIAGRWIAGDVATGLEVAWVAMLLSTLWFATAAGLARWILWLQRSAGDPDAARRNAHHRGVMWGSMALSLLGLAGWLVVGDLLAYLAPALSMPPQPASDPGGISVAMWLAGGAGLVALLWAVVGLRARRDLGGRGVADVALVLGMLGIAALGAPMARDAVLGALTAQGGASLQASALQRRGLVLPQVPGVAQVELPAAVDVVELAADGSATWHEHPDAQMIVVYADRTLAWWQIDAAIRPKARNGHSRVYAMVHSDASPWPVPVSIPLSARTHRLRLREARFGGVEIARGPRIVAPGALISQSGAAWVVGVDDGVTWSDTVAAIAAMQADGVEPQVYLDGLLLERDFVVR